MFESIRKSEIHSLICQLSNGSHDCENRVVDMKAAFFEMTLNIMMRMNAGKRYYGENMAELEEAKKFKEMVAEAFELSGAMNIGDFVPVLKWAGFSGTEKRLKQKRDQLMQDLIEDHRRMRSDSFSEQMNKTMIDVLLSLQESEHEYYKDEIIVRNIIIID